MNYYIQGDKDKADQIKAAFEKLGCDVTGFDMRNDNILFFTYKLEGGGKVISTTNANLYTANIIKTHPDYKELELPVEPKFKVGDWVVIDNCHNSTYQVEHVREYDYMLKHTHGGLMPFPFSSAEQLRLWTIEDAKDGDVLVTTKIRSCPFIYRKTDIENNLAYYYAGIDGNGDFSEGCLKGTLYHFGLVSDVVPANKGQHDLLFAKMKEAGYKWDEKKKELRKIKPHYDISNFKPFDKVLIRDNDRGKWRASIFSYHIKGRQTCYPFCCIGNSFSQCIPYECNEHLLGTTDMPDEMYINW